MKPSVVVTAADLDKIGTRVPEFYTGDLFCPVGKTPLYLGQPVGLLIFETFDAFDQARLALRDGTFVRFGEETGPVAMPAYGAYRFTRVAGPTPDAPDVYSPIQAGWVSPGHFRRTRAADMVAGSPRTTGRAYAKAATYGEQIRAELAAEKSGSSGAGPRIRDAIGRSDVSRAGKRPRLVRRGPQKPRARARRAVALRGRGSRSRICLAKRARAVQAGAHQCPVRLYRRRLRRTRSYAVRAVRGAGGDVLPRSSGPARA